MKAAVKEEINIHLSPYLSSFPFPYYLSGYFQFSLMHLSILHVFNLL